MISFKDDSPRSALFRLVPGGYPPPPTTGPASKADGVASTGLVAQTASFRLFCPETGRGYVLQSRDTGKEILLYGQRASELESALGAALLAGRLTSAGRTGASWTEVLEVCLLARAY